MSDINIKLISGEGGQIDLFGHLQATDRRKPKNCYIIGEMKDRKSKVGKKDVEKFLQKIALVKMKYKEDNAISIYISTSGFWKPAQELLEKNNIFYGSSDKFLQKI